MRVRAGVWALVLLAILCFGAGYWWFIQPVPFENVLLYPFVGLGILCLAIIPFAKRAANKQADMDEMLEDYRRRKQHR